MNIFISDINPDISAKNLDDKRVIKMILESAQILQTALYNTTGKCYCNIKPAWFNHPVVKWAGLNKGNFWWVLNHLQSLTELYKEIYGRYHAYHNTTAIFSIAMNKIPGDDSDITALPNCTIYKHLSSIEAYQKHLVYKWKFLDKREPTWKLRDSPAFLNRFWNSVDISDGRDILVVKG